MENGSESTERFTVSQDEGLATPDEPTSPPSHKDYKEFSETASVEFEYEDSGWGYTSPKKAHKK
jgi:hypothetical protein